MTLEEAIKKVKSIYPDAKINHLSHNACILYSRQANVNIMSYASLVPLPSYSDSDAWIGAAEWVDRELILRLEK